MFKKNYNEFTHKVAIVALFASIIFISWKLSDVFILILGGALFSILLSRVSKNIQKLIPISYIPALILFILSMLVMVGVFILIAAPPIVEQAKQFSQELPELLTTVRNIPSQLGLSLQGIGLERISSSASAAFGTATTVIGSIINGGAQLSVVILIGFFFALSPAKYKNGSLSFVPKKQRKKAEKTWDKTSHMLWGWLLGRGAAMAAVAVLVAIGLAIIGMPFILLLATVAGILNFIPTIGPMLGAVPALLIALSQGPTMLGYVLLLYIIVQVIENNIITPVVQMQMVNLAPATVVLSQVIVGMLFGPVAVMLAVPIMIVCYVILQNYYLEDIQ